MSDQTIGGINPQKWNWWVGPDNDHYIWGGFPQRWQAVAEGNNRAETGGTFHIIEARGMASEPDSEDGGYDFAEYRNHAECKVTG